MKRKRALLACIAGALALVTTACASDGGGAASSPPGVGAKVVLKLASQSPENTNVGQALKAWVDAINKASNGQIEVQAHYGDLGAGPQLLQLLQAGTIDGSYSGTIDIATIDPEMNAWGLPFLFACYNQAYAAQDGSVGAAALAGLSKYNLEGLAWSDIGFKSFANNVRPINSPADLKGLKLRAVSGAIPTQMMQALGVNAVPLASTEINTSIQQHLVDGLDAPPAYLVSTGLDKLLKYYSVTNHVFTGEVFLLSKKAWDKLTPQQQQIVKTATEEAGKTSRATDRQLEETDQQTLTQDGVTVNTVSDLAPFKNAVQPVYDSFDDQTTLKSIEEAAASASC